jgi:HK97 family phage major capsid protein
MNMSLIELREEQIEAHVAVQAARAAIKDAGEDADIDSLDTLEATFTEAETRYNTAKANLELAERREIKARKMFELERRGLDADKRLENPAPPTITVGREPLTYREHGQHSMFTDLFRCTSQPGMHPDAAERLSRHAREMAFERAVKAGDIPREAQFDLSSTDSAGGYLVAPLWLQEEFVTLARAGRVAADVLGPRSLPPNTDSINLPRMSAGTTVTTIADNASVSETDATFDTISGDVKTSAGLQDVSQQLVDRGVPGVDSVIFADLAKAYAVVLDTAVINSATANNLGLLQVSGINAVTYTQATPTVANLYPKLADAIQRVHVNVFMPPTAILMHPVRWAFILAGIDGNNRPLITPYAPQNAVGSFGGVVSQGAVGSVQGIPVYTDPNIPNTLGASTTEDRIIVVRADECFLYEDAAGPYVETFRDVGSGNLTVRFRLHNYWAQINSRRPKAISVISGTGLVAPTF